MPGASNPEGLSPFDLSAQLYRALLSPGDRVLVENPGFDLFHKIAGTYGYGVDRFERLVGSVFLAFAVALLRFRPR